MKIQAYAPDPLNEQASVLVDAQTDIKIAIKQGVLSGAPSFVVKQSIERIVARAIARIRSYFSYALCGRGVQAFQRRLAWNYACGASCSCGAYESGYGAGKSTEVFCSKKFTGTKSGSSVIGTRLNV